MFYGNHKSWLLNLNLICKTLWAGAGSGLLISMLEKLNLFYLSGLIAEVLLMWKWMGLFPRESHLLRCCGLLFFLKWIGFRTLFLLLKLPPKKLEPWVVLWSSFLQMLLCMLCSKSTIGSCTEYCCHFRAGTPSCYLNILVKL